jgi:hypothetical protein
MPFITPPSLYQAAGSNITGGAPNLIVNNGINNMALGNFVLTTHDTGDNNIAIGNGAMADDLTAFNMVAIGFNAKRERGETGSSSNDSVMIGTNVAGSSGANFSKSVILGVEAGQIIAGELNDGDVLIGYATGASNTGLNSPSNNNVIVGREAANGSEGAMIENVAIGFQAVINSDMRSANVIVGASAMTGGFGEIQRNVIIGYSASQKNTNFDLITTQEQTIIGFQAAYGTNFGVDNTIIGYQAGLSFDESGAVAGATPSANNIVLGKKSLYWASISGSLNDPQYNDNIIIGNNTASNLDSVGSDISPSLTNNIVIGQSVNTTAVADLGFDNKIIIGNFVTVPNGADYEILIGDPNETYTSVIVGGVDLLAGGGGFAAQAFQDDAANVSITSVASDLVSGFSGTYIINADTDNATVATSSALFEAAAPTQDATVSLSADLSNAVVQGSYNGVGGAGSFTFGSQETLSFIGVGSGNGTNAAQLNLNVDNVAEEVQYNITGTGTPFVHAWTVPAETGADTATFVATNAPAAISPTNWIAITLNGVAGYIPFFSA